MSRSIAPSPRTNNDSGRFRGARVASDSTDPDKQLDAAIALANTLAYQIAGGVRDLLFDQLAAIVDQAIAGHASRADLARAIARASARSARLTVVVTMTPEPGTGGYVAAAVRQVLRRILPNRGGTDLERAATPPVADSP